MNKGITIASLLLLVGLVLALFGWGAYASSKAFTLKLYGNWPPTRSELEESLPWYFSQKSVPISETNQFKVYWKIEQGDQVVFYSALHCFMFQGAYSSNGTVKAIIPWHE